MLLFSTELRTNAQEKTIQRSDQQWFQYYHRRNLNDNWLLTYDAGWRHRNWSASPSLCLARAGINYKINNTTIVGAGMATFFSFLDNRLNRFELRPYQEITFSSNDTRILTNHRIRIEERVFRGMANNPEENQNNMRFRYRFQFSLPICHFLLRGSERSLMAQFADEIFINAGKSIVYNALDNNRIIIGPVLKYNEKIQLSLSYMHQFGQRNSPGLYDSSDVLWLTVLHSTSSI